MSKIIHYCWFGDKPLPSLAKKCIKSWKKYLPGPRTHMKIRNGRLSVMLPAFMR